MSCDAGPTQILGHWPADIPGALREEALGWSALWNDPSLAQECTVAWSDRMTRCLGIAYTRRSVVRLRRGLARAEAYELLREVLCHELAHVAVHRQLGTSARPHGAAWKQRLRAAGFHPRVRIPMAQLAPDVRRALKTAPARRARRPRRPRRRLARWIDRALRDLRSTITSSLSPSGCGCDRPAGTALPRAGHP